MSLFVFGIGTFIQVKKVGPIGSGLLSIQGTSFAFVTPILAIVAASLKDGKTPNQTLARISVWQYAELVAGTCGFCNHRNLQRQFQQVFADGIESTCLQRKKAWII